MIPLWKTLNIYAISRNKLSTKLKKMMPLQALRLSRAHPKLQRNNVACAAIWKLMRKRKSLKTRIKMRSCSKINARLDGFYRTNRQKSRYLKQRLCKRLLHNLKKISNLLPRKSVWRTWTIQTETKMKNHLTLPLTNTSALPVNSKRKRTEKSPE